MTPQDRIAIAIDTLERAMGSARGALMPQFPNHNTPGERYVRAFDVLSGRIPDALTALRRALKDLEATESSGPPSLAWCFAISLGVAACGARYEVLTDRPTNVTCPACRKWIEEQQAPADDDQPRYQVRKSGFDFDVIDTHDPDPVVATYESESEAEDEMDRLNRAASGAVGEEER